MKTLEEINERHERENKAIDSILFGETGQLWMNAEWISLILGHVAHAHGAELLRHHVREAERK